MGRRWLLPRPYLHQPWVIWAACLLHFWWAILLLFSTAPERATPVHTLSHLLGGRPGAIPALAGVAALALVSSASTRLSVKVRAMLLLPQQTLLLIGAGGSFWAIVLRHYADHVLRPWPFIAADQAPVILLALLYVGAVQDAAKAIRPPPEPHPAVHPNRRRDDPPWTPQQS